MSAHNLSGEDFAKRVTALMYGIAGVELSAEEQASLTTAAELLVVHDTHLQAVVDYALLLQELGGRHRRIGFLITLLKELLQDIAVLGDSAALKAAIERIRGLS